MSIQNALSQSFSDIFGPDTSSKKTGSDRGVDSFNEAMVRYSKESAKRQGVEPIDVKGVRLKGSSH